MNPPSKSLPVEILIAEELGLVREGLAAICNSISGFHVAAQVGTAAAALAEIERLKPGVALLDLSLSDIAVTEVLHSVQDRKLPTRCVVLSVRIDNRTIVEALRAGASGFVLKTATSAQMAEALNGIVGGVTYLSPEIDVMSVLVDKKQGSVDTDPMESLSSREFQVFSMLVEGIRPKEIGARLSLSPKTVDTYRSSLMRKLAIDCIAGLVRFAIQRDFVKVAA
jgi:DNA-binding NarL/FixJ family response regulator